MDNQKKTFINFESAGTLEFQHAYHTLWENPAYYNTNELSLHNILVKPKENKISYFSKEGLIRDAKYRRIISKESLYKDSGQIEEFNENTCIPSNYWTLEYQKKQGKESAKIMWQQRQSNKIQRKIHKALSQPLKIDKAVSMMAKMGWKGGALGKCGTGILEPIIPNAAYAMNTVGFGKLETIPKPQKTGIYPMKMCEIKKKHKEQYLIFHTNIFYCILEFLQNDFEIELMFENTLDNRERKRIHDFISNLYKPYFIMDRCLFDFVQLKELLTDLRKQSYRLTTMSEGEGENRSLCVYKEAPGHMYLVTHHDLRNEPEDTEEIAQKPNIDNPNNSVLKMYVEFVNGSKTSITLENYDQIVIYEETDIPISTDEETTESKEANIISDTDNIFLKVNEEVTKTKEDVAETREHITNLIKNLKELVQCNTSTPENVDAKENITKSLDSVKEPDIATDFMFNITVTEDNNRLKINSVNEFINDERMRRKQARYEKYTEKILEKKANKKPLQQKTLIQAEKDTSPIIKSILNPQTTSYKTLAKGEINNLILEYFKEFSKDDKCTEFKFLGAFQDVEVEMINEFISDVWRYVNDADYVSDDIYTLMSQADCAFGVRKDINGGAVIYKIPNTHA